MFDFFTLAALVSLESNAFEFSCWGWLELQIEICDMIPRIQLRSVIFREDGKSHELWTANLLSNHYLGLQMGEKDSNQTLWWKTETIPKDDPVDETNQVQEKPCHLFFSA